MGAVVAPAAEGIRCTVNLQREEFTFQGTNHFSVVWQMSSMWFGMKYLVAVLFACEINGLCTHLILNSFSVKAFQ